MPLKFIRKQEYRDNIFRKQFVEQPRLHRVCQLYRRLMPLQFIMKLEYWHNIFRKQSNNLTDYLYHLTHVEHAALHPVPRMSLLPCLPLGSAQHIHCTTSCFVLHCRVYSLYCTNDCTTLHLQLKVHHDGEVITPLEADRSKGIIDHLVHLM